MLLTSHARFEQSAAVKCCVTQPWKTCASIHVCISGTLTLTPPRWCPSERQTQPTGDGLQPTCDGLQPTSDGLRPNSTPNSDGLQPKSDGLQPNGDGLQPTGDGLQPNSDGIQLNSDASNLVAFNLLAMASSLLENGLQAK